MTPILTRVRTVAAITLIAALGALPAPSLSQDQVSLDLAASWTQLREAELDPDSVLEAKTRALIGVAVAAHIACGPCVHVHASMAKAYGASGAELAEVLAAAGLTRRMGTAFADVQVNSEAFRMALSEVMSIVGPKVAELD